MLQYQTMLFSGPVIPFVPPHLPDDIDIINFNGGGVPGPQGPTGPQGIQGPTGPQGIQGPTGTTGNLTTTSTGSSYQATTEDCYIGVHSKEPTIITLPPDAKSGQLIIVKLEMGSPIGNRKVTIIPPGMSLIDGDSTVTLQNPWEVVRLLYHNKNWFKI